jgi:hypothetical protein
MVSRNLAIWFQLGRAWDAAETRLAAIRTSVVLRVPFVPVP